jgi:hypothetical protein
MHSGCGFTMKKAPQFFNCEALSIRFPQTAASSGVWITAWIYSSAKMSTWLVSFTNNMPITKVASAMTMGYHRP